MTPPDAPTWLTARPPGAGCMERVLTLARQNAPESDATSWIWGVQGEQEVAVVLAALPTEGHVLHAVPAGSKGRDLDHLLIGPAGVIVINTKHHHNAKVNHSRDCLWIGKHPHNAPRDVAAAATTTTELLCRLSGVRAPGHGIVALVCAASLRRAQSAVGTVVHAEDLPRHIRALPASLSAAQVNALLAVAQDPATWEGSARVTQDAAGLSADYRTVTSGSVGCNRHRVAAPTPMPMPSPTGHVRGRRAGRRPGRPSGPTRTVALAKIVLGLLLLLSLPSIARIVTADLVPGASATLTPRATTPSASTAPGAGDKVALPPTQQQSEAIATWTVHLRAYTSTALAHTSYVNAAMSEPSPPAAAPERCATALAQAAPLEPSALAAPTPALRTAARRYRDAVRALLQACTRRDHTAFQSATGRLIDARTTGNLTYRAALGQPAYSYKTTF